MYKLSYLPVTSRDIADAVNYIAETLATPKAAFDLLNALDESIFPTVIRTCLPKNAKSRPIQE